MRMIRTRKQRGTTSVTPKLFTVRCRTMQRNASPFINGLLAGRCHKDGMWNESNGTTTAANSRSLFSTLQRMHTIRSWTRRGKTYTRRGHRAAKRKRRNRSTSGWIAKKHSISIRKLKAGKRSGRGSLNSKLEWMTGDMIQWRQDRNLSVGTVIIFSIGQLQLVARFLDKENCDDREILIEAINYNFRDTVQHNIWLMRNKRVGKAVAVGRIVALDKWSEQCNLHILCIPSVPRRFLVLRLIYDISLCVLLLLHCSSS